MERGFGKEVRQEEEKQMSNQDAEHDRAVRRRRGEAGKQETKAMYGMREVRMRRRRGRRNNAAHDQSLRNTSDNLDFEPPQLTVCPMIEETITLYAAPETLTGEGRQVMMGKQKMQRRLYSEDDEEEKQKRKVEEEEERKRNEAKKRLVKMEERMHKRDSSSHRLPSSVRKNIFCLERFQLNIFCELT